MPREVTIVDYEAGNLTSVRLAVQELERRPEVTADPDAVREAERLIFPGVGAASAAMSSLRDLGLREAIVDYAATGRPMLGICLGAQIILERSEEGDVPCLGLMPGTVQRLSVPDGVKVPHMGWNAVTIARDHPIWNGVESESQFYFVHSYAPVPALSHAAIGLTDYHGQFVSALAVDNVVACQFHPERSGRVGLRVLGNFLEWEP
ncbi:MAG: imidazole glycerol phosphate synthase subunit HisH [Candidatus Brocadiia bacterium]